MSLPETQDLTQAQNWTPELLIGVISEKTASSVAAFLGAEGMVQFSFEDLIKKIGDTIQFKGNDDIILRILACLCMRMDLEERAQIRPGNSAYGIYSRTLKALEITVPPLPEAITTKPQPTPTRWWQGFRRAA